MIKVVIIDIDDTLCLTEEACFKLENEVAVLMGFFPMSRDIHKNNWGIPIQKAIIERFPGINVNEFMKRQEKVVSNYVKRGMLDAIPEENIKILSLLKNFGKKIAILTSRRFSEVKHFLDKNHVLNNKIDIFYHADNSEYLKPDFRVFNQIISYFNVKPIECIYIGDSLDDAVAANGAKIPFIAVLESKLRKRDDFNNVSVFKFVDKFSDIINYIN